MLSREGEEKESGTDGGEGIATEEGESTMKTAFEVEGVPLHYSLELGNTMTSILSLQDHHFSVCKQAVYIWKKV